MQLLQTLSQALKYFLPLLIRKLSLVRTDNTTVVAYTVNIQGRLHSWQIAPPRLISWSNSHLAISESHSCIGQIGPIHVPGNWMELGTGWISALPALKCVLFWCAHCMHMWTKQLDLGNESNWLYLGLCSTWASTSQNQGCQVGLWRLLPHWGYSINWYLGYAFITIRKLRKPQ